MRAAYLRSLSPPKKEGSWREDGCKQTALILMKISTAYLPQKKSDPESQTIKKCHSNISALLHSIKGCRERWSQQQQKAYWPWPNGQRYLVETWPCTCLYSFVPYTYFVIFKFNLDNCDERSRKSMNQSITLFQFEIQFTRLRFLVDRKAVQFTKGYTTHIFLKSQLTWHQPASAFTCGKTEGFVKRSV